MADNDTKSLLQQILVKSDALECKLDEKLTRIENTIRAEINGIKKDLQTYKDRNYEEIKLIKKTVNDLEASQSLLSEKYEEQKEKIQQLINDNKKLYLENKNLNNSIESLQENQNTGKEQHIQLVQYLWKLLGSSKLPESHNRRERERAALNL